MRRPQTKSGWGFVYFGKVADDPRGEAALEQWLDQKDELLAGRTPRPRGEGLTVRDLCNKFLNAKLHLLDTGELSLRTFRDYRSTVERIADVLGRTRLVADLRAEDFEKLRSRLAKTRGPVALGNEIQRVRVVFKYGHDAGLIEHPVRFGPTFKRPAKKVLRKARHANGKRMFEAAELRKVIKGASQPLKAMVLLAINCGFGQSDLANLPQSALDLKRGWVDYPRPKTGIERRCPLWPETVEAVREAIEKRPIPAVAADRGLAFLTARGNRWVKVTAKGTKEDPVSQLTNNDAVAKEFSKLLKSLGLKRPRLNFYALRHTFETEGGESRDQVAVDRIMGHVRDDMASLYRERIGDDRLRAVVDVVRGWLFPPADVAIEELFEIAVATTDDPEAVTDEVRGRIAAATQQLEAALVEMSPEALKEFTADWHERFTEAGLAVPAALTAAASGDEQAADEPRVIRMPARTA